MDILIWNLLIRWQPFILPCLVYLCSGANVIMIFLMKGCAICTLNQILRWLIQGGEMGGACGTYGETENAYKVRRENLKEGHHFEDLD
jgi:hypothetical protein